MTGGRHPSVSRDIRPDDREDVTVDEKMMTYAELADALGIKGDSARRLVRRKRWRREVGNDGQSRIAVPVEFLNARPDDPPAVTEDVIQDVTTDNPPDIAIAFARLEVEIHGLRELLDSERKRADAAETDRNRWHEQAVRPWWKRLAAG